MLITHIELENIKSYRHIHVDFRRGTTAISGANGAGKTTLVEAIGFALFDYLPYSQIRFVREGEKYGRVVVHLMGGDDRPYTVERRCGSGSRWFIHDQEADFRLEQNADVLDKLHELFGIDRERPLDSLFRDALGVPQGTFTSIFLETASKRKQTFDALLQIEDYKTAADNLLETQKHYKEQVQAQQSKIQQLTYETRELAEWRVKLKEARLLDEQQKEQNALWSQQFTKLEIHAANLNEQLTQLNTLEQRYQASKVAYANAQERLHDREQQMEAARLAHVVMMASLADYQRYQQAQEILQRLQQDSLQRNHLLQQKSQLDSSLATTRTKVESWQTRLKEVAEARQKIVELATLVEQQSALELKRDEAMQKVSRYDAIVTEEKHLSQQRAMHLRKQEDLQRKITEIEPLVPLAQRLQEYADALSQLRIQSSERNGKQQLLGEKRGLLQEKQLGRDRDAEKLRKAERNITIIEEHRHDAEEVPILQAQYDQLSAQKHRLEGNLEGYAKSRAQSIGGQCPLLNESCLNIQGRGIASLESYFEGLLKEEQAQMASVLQQQEAITARIGPIKKFADALNKLEQYVEQRDSLAEQWQRSVLEVTRLEHDIADLVQALHASQSLDQQIQATEAAYNESKQADAKTRELAGFYKQVLQFQEQIQQYQADLQERREKIEALRGSDMQLKQVETELAKLDDPRSRHKAQQAIVARESYFEQQLRSEQAQQQETLQHIQVLQAQLNQYHTLDADLVQQDTICQLSHEGYQRYLQNVNEARLLSEREHAHQQQLELAEQTEKRLREVEQAYFAAKIAFSKEELDTLKGEIEHLRSALAVLAQKMQHHQEYIKQLESQIEQAQTLRVELEATQQECQTLDDLHTMTEQFRKLMKEAAPHVLKAMLGDISAEANRIFGEVMGDRSAQLSWQNDYEIVLRRQGVTRSFAQLSGGEQMSAALSVRLALLKKLSTLNIAFFDEPTQNMDELRRMNLADQIRRVRGFDQLVVISHDDTFEQKLDALVRLSKVDGETCVLADDAMIGQDTGYGLFAG